jgi:hypothetical protein
MKMVEMAVLEDFVLGDRFLNGFAVKMANWVFDPRRRLNYMMRSPYFFGPLCPPHCPSTPRRPDLCT